MGKKGRRSGRALLPFRLGQKVTCPGVLGEDRVGTVESRHGNGEVVVNFGDGKIQAPARLFRAVEP